MLVFRCSTQDNLQLGELEPFQGELKKRSDVVIKELADNIQEEGLLMPFVVWRTTDGHNKLLDGHGRLQALQLLGTPSEFAVPVIFVDADNENQAKQALLQIVSSYGNISKKGALAFCSTIPEYRAPSIRKFVTPPVSKRKNNVLGKSLVKILVPADKEAEVRKILAGVEYIEVI